MQVKKHKGIDRFLFDDESEFRRFHLGADVLNWRSPDVKEGSWVETDEGGITTCLSVGKLKDSRTITTVCGTFRPDCKTHRMTNNIAKYPSNFVPNKGAQKLLHRKKLSKKEQAIARLVMLGTEEIEAFKKIYPEAKSEVYIRQKISTLTNKKKWKSYMSYEFTKLLDKEEMTKKWGLRVLKQIAEDTKAPAGVRKEIADDILEDLGENRKGQKQIESVSRYAVHRIDDGKLKQLDKIGETVKTEKNVKEIKEES